MFFRESLWDYVVNAHFVCSGNSFFLRARAAERRAFPLGPSLLMPLCETCLLAAYSGMVREEMLRTPLTR